MKMKNVIIIINIIALVITGIWMYSSNYDFEPIILFLTLVATLIGLIYSQKTSKMINKSEIDGEGNAVIQGNTKSDKHIDQSNESKIKGKGNQVNQG